jgi:hypothetical protein
LCKAPVEERVKLGIQTVDITSLRNRKRTTTRDGDIATPSCQMEGNAMASRGLLATKSNYIEVEARMEEELQH